MSKAGANKRNAEGGFTLLELLVALAVGAFALALALPLASRSRADLELRSTAYGIAADLRSARATARRTNIQQALVVNVQQRRFWTRGSTPRRMIPPRFALAMEVSDEERLGAGTGAVRFFPDGSATGGRILLRDEGRSATVSVDWLTGDVQVIWSR
jgi:general secretion pathway protein H